jgi:hypothetical protein
MTPQKTGTGNTARTSIFDPSDMKFWAYAVYKTEHPIMFARAGSQVEKMLAPYKDCSFSFPANGTGAPAKLITLSAVGDLLCTKGVQNSGDKLYEFVEDEIFGADIRYANLESALTCGNGGAIEVHAGETPPVGASMEQYRALLFSKEKKFDIVQLANNHIMDNGETGLETTEEQLRRDGIRWVGINESQEESCAPAITKTAGLKIGWVAFTSDVNGKPLPDGKPWRVNITPFHIEKDPDISPIIEQIRACRSAGCDLVLVTLHWGLEYEFYPHPDQRKWAQAITDAGADAIIGHHPHVIQPVEILHPAAAPEKSVPVLYSLGNLTPLLSNPATALSLIARFSIEKGPGPDGRAGITGLELIPTITLLENAEGSPLRVIRLRDAADDKPACGVTPYVERSAAYAGRILGNRWRT